MYSVTRNQSPAVVLPVQKTSTTFGWWTFRRVQSDRGRRDAFRTDHGSRRAPRAARRREERRAVDEGGGGESEGFELAEQDLVEHASHGDQHTPSRIMRDAWPDEESGESVYAEADSEHHSD